MIPFWRRAQGYGFIQCFLYELLDQPIVVIAASEDAAFDGRQLA